MPYDDDEYLAAQRRDQAERDYYERMEWEHYNQRDDHETDSNSTGEGQESL